MTIPIRFSGFIVLVAYINFQIRMRCFVRKLAFLFPGHSGISICHTHSVYVCVQNWFDVLVKRDIRCHITDIEKIKCFLLDDFRTFSSRNVILSG